MTIVIRFGVHAVLRLPAGVTALSCKQGHPVAPPQWYADADGQAVTILGTSDGVHCYKCLAFIGDEALAIVMHGEDSRTANVFVVKREWLEVQK